jgi:cytochrome c1
MPGKNYTGFRFSGLDQINVGNANNLQVAWTFSVGVLRGQEAATIVADNAMFVVTPYPNILYAIDLTKPGGPHIAGVLTNTPDNLIEWIHNPPGVDPRTAMPNLGVDEAAARDIAAYLYTLR